MAPASRPPQASRRLPTIRTVVDAAGESTRRSWRRGFSRNTAMSTSGTGDSARGRASIGRTYSGFKSLFLALARACSIEGYEPETEMPDGLP